MNYFFVGEDEFSKDIKLQKIKQELFAPQLDSFNFEILYSKGLDLRTFQERLLLLPTKARRRLILIKDVPRLNNDIRRYLLNYLKKPFTHVSLILDARRIDERDQFFSQISPKVKLVNFWQARQINAFTLARQITQCEKEKSFRLGHTRARPAMKLLRQLLMQGEKPERILGALRYQLNQERLNLSEKKKKLKFLLNCDIDIKTGRLKPEFALERLLVSLCYF